MAECCRLDRVEHERCQTRYSARAGMGDEQPSRRWALSSNPRPDCGTDPVRSNTVGCQYDTVPPQSVRVRILVRADDQWGISQRRSGNNYLKGSSNNSLPD